MTNIFDHLAGLEIERQRLLVEEVNSLLGKVRPTPAQAAYLGGQMLPLAASAEAAGQVAPWPPNSVSIDQLPEYMRTAEPMLSLKQNIAQGNLLDAGLQGVGLAGDALSVAGPLAAVGMPLKVLAKAGQAFRKSKSLLPDDVPRLKFEGDSAPEELAEGTKRTFSTTGKYRGGPPGINSPQKLAAMQKRLRGHMKRGADHRLWYEKTNDFIKQQTAGRPGRQDQYAATAAITSQGTAVPGNATMAMKGYNQAIVGDAINTGRFPQTMGPSIKAVHSGASPPLGPKREPFYEALNQLEGRLRQTNDIRQGRAFGYKNADGSEFSSGLNTAQHRFIDEETAKLVAWANKTKAGGYDDWNADRMQAAIWVSQKAEQEGTSIADAGRMFQDFTPQAVIRTEAAPSASSGLLSGQVFPPHLKGLHDPNNRQALEEFSALQDEAMQTPLGSDYLTAQSGAMTSPAYAGPGIYEGVSNPGVGIPISVGKLSRQRVRDPVTSKTVEASIMDPASRKVVEANAAMQGLLRAQDTVGYTSIMKAPNAASRNAIEVNLGQTIKPSQMKALESAINDEFGKGLLIPLHTENGVAIITAGAKELGKLVAGTPAPYKRRYRGRGSATVKEALMQKTPAWQKKLDNVVKETLDPESTRWGLNTGDLVGDTVDWTYTPSRYLGPLEDVGPEMTNLLDAGAKRISPKLQTLDAWLVRVLPSAGERSIIVTRVRKAYSQKGIAGVRELVDKGLVPAVVLGVLLGAQDPGPSTHRPSRPPQGPLI